MAPNMNTDARMQRSPEKWIDVRLPRPVVRWLRTMSARINVPQHRVLDALLDRYAENLPDDVRRRLADEHQSRTRRPQ